MPGPSKAGTGVVLRFALSPYGNRRIRRSRRPGRPDGTFRFTRAIGRPMGDAVLASAPARRCHLKATPWEDLAQGRAR